MEEPKHQKQEKDDKRKNASFRKGEPPAGKLERPLTWSGGRELSEALRDRMHDGVSYRGSCEGLKERTCRLGDEDRGKMRVEGHLWVFLKKIRP